MLVRLQTVSCAWFSPRGLVVLAFCIVLCEYTFAAEEAQDVPALTLSAYEEPLRRVIAAFECITDKRQIGYLTELLCHRYLVLMFFIAMPEDMLEFKRLKHHTSALGELTARLNRRSGEALDIFDACSDRWGECSYRTFLPAIARRMGLFELIKGLVKEFERFALEDLPFVFSLSGKIKIKSANKRILDKKIEQWRDTLAELKKSTWCCFDLDNSLELSKSCADSLLLYSRLANIHLSKLADKRFENIERRINRFKDKVDEALSMSASYGTILEYAEFKRKLAQAFFSSVRSAELYRFFHTYLCKKIDRVPKPIFTLHHLSVVVTEHRNADDRALFWKALKYFAVVGDHFTYYHTLLCAWREYCKKRIAALDALISKLRVQLDTVDTEIKEHQLARLLSCSLEQRDMLQDAEASNLFLRESFLVGPTCTEWSSVANRYRDELDSYLEYLKDKTGLQTIQELLGNHVDKRSELFFTGSEVVADFCSAGYRTTLAKYVQLFFDYYFGKTPWMIKGIGEEVLRTIVSRYTERANPSNLLNDLSILYVDTQVPDWVEPCYDVRALEAIRAVLHCIDVEHCQQKQRDDAEKQLVPVVEDQSAPEPIRSSAMGSTIYGRKMAWHELLSKLEEIERLYIPRVCIREWSKDAGYAHCWRSQKSSLCVTYFFFKELRRRRRRSILLDISVLSKQTDRQKTGWDFYHAFPVELDHPLLNEYSVRIDQDDRVWTQLGLKKDARKSYAYVVRAKIVPGYTDPIRLQDPNFEDNDFGHTGYFVWLCRGNDVCYHRQFHAVQRSSLGVCMPSPHVSPVTPLTCF